MGQLCEDRQEWLVGSKSQIRDRVRIRLLFLIERFGPTPGLGHGRCANLRSTSVIGSALWRMGGGQNERQFASPPISEAPDEICSSDRMSQGSKATTPWEDRRRPQRWSSERQACLPHAPLSACYRLAGACASAAVSHHSV